MRLLEYAILLAVWAVAAVGVGALLARLARALHPDLSFRRLWLFYTILTAILAGAVLVVWFP